MEKIMLLLETSPSFMKNAVHVYSSLVRNLHMSKSFQSKRKESSKGTLCEPTPVAIILCGSGGLDGTEITEAISLAIHCSKKNLLPRFFAPDIDLCGVVNHFTKEPDTSGLTRNALVEGARIARPTIKPLCECNTCSLQALIIPGGFGAAQTLSNFTTKGADCDVLPELRQIIEDFSCDKKPIGSLCIGSAILARVLEGVKVTLGKESPKEDWPYGAAIKRVKDMGAKIELKDVTGVTYCKRYNVFSNPAWMYSPATYAEVHEGIGNMISKMAKIIIR